MNQRLLTILEKELNSKGISTSRGNYKFFSPFKPHRKRKLEIQLDENSPYYGYWHCWISDQKGRSFYSLLKKIKSDKNTFERVAELINDSKYRRVYYNKEEQNNIIKLPDNFRSLTINYNTPDYKNAMFYLKNRGITKYDILKYNIGYCETGQYAGYIIIPSYDENGELNYFVTRSYYDIEFKHKNPSMNRDIIGFDLLINWDEPIVLVEGAFDAITGKINAIPLFGKNIMDLIKLKIIKKKVKDIYICLDPDAIKNSLDICEYFMHNGINVYLVELEDKDPNELGYINFRNLILNTEKLTFSKIIKCKLKNNI